MTKQFTAFTAMTALSVGSVFAGTAMVGGKNPPAMPAASGCSTEISYSSIDAAYSRTFVSQEGFDDANGIGIKLEFSPINQLYFVGEGDLNSSSFEGSDVDGWGALAGVGGYLPITSGFHFATDVGGIWEGAEFEGDKISDGGWYVRPHLRAKFACAEIHVGAKYVSLNDFGDRWEVFGDVYYEVAPRLDLTVGVATVLEGDRDWALRTGVRYRF
jgi:hypothetical protein